MFVVLELDWKDLIVSLNGVLANFVWVDNLFSAWALAENIFPVIPTLGYICIFKSSAMCFLNEKAREDEDSPECLSILL